MLDAVEALVADALSVPRVEEEGAPGKEEEDHKEVIEEPVHAGHARDERQQINEDPDE